MLGQGDDRLGTLIFVVSLRGLVALGSPWLLTSRHACRSLNPLSPSVLGGAAAPLGTQKFPWAVSFRICFLTVRSATARRNWAFSFCRSFSFLADVIGCKFHTANQTRYVIGDPFVGKYWYSQILDPGLLDKHSRYVLRDCRGSKGNRRRSWPERAEQARNRSDPIDVPVRTD